MKYLKSLGINLAIFIILLLVLEIVWRIIGLGVKMDALPKLARYAPDKNLPYKYKSNYTDTYKECEKCVEMTLQTNSIGIRDIDYTNEKPQNTIRIIGLGASWAAGAFVNKEDSYFAVAENMLNDSLSQNVQFLKFGIERYYTKFERMILEHYGIKYNPDIVVIDAMLSDVTNTCLGNYVNVSGDGYLQTSDAKKLGNVGSWLYINSRLASSFIYRYLEKKKINIKGKDLLQDNGPFEYGWQEVEGEMTKVKELCEKNGIKMVMLFIPNYGYHKNDMSYAENRYKKIAKKLGADFISTYKQFRQYGANKQEEIFHTDVWHPNEKGHKLIGEVLGNSLFRSLD